MSLWCWDLHVWGFSRARQRMCLHTRTTRQGAWRSARHRASWLQILHAAQLGDPKQVECVTQLLSKRSIWNVLNRDAATYRDYDYGSTLQHLWSPVKTYQFAHVVTRHHTSSHVVTYRDMSSRFVGMITSLLWCRAWIDSLLAQRFHAETSGSPRGYCVGLCCVVLCCVVLCCAVLCCAVLCCVQLCGVVLYCGATLPFTTL